MWRSGVRHQTYVLVQEALLNQVVVEEEVDVEVKRVVFELKPTNVAERLRVLLHTLQMLVFHCQRRVLI